MPTKLQEQMGRMTGMFVTMQDTITQQLRALREAVSSELSSAMPPELVAHIEKLDTEVDQAEHQLEEEALRLLALQAPVAGNLRQVLLMIQSTPDLERAGDYAKHLARLLAQRTTPWPGDEHLGAALRTLESMAAKLRSASFPLDGELARQVVLLDAEIDEYYEQVQHNQLRASQADMQAALSAAQFWRAAERLGDHLKNVAVRISEKM